MNQFECLDTFEPEIIIFGNYKYFKHQLISYDDYHRLSHNDRKKFREKIKEVYTRPTHCINEPDFKRSDDTPSSYTYGSDSGLNSSSNDSSSFDFGGGDSGGGGSSGDW